MNKLPANQLICWGPLIAGVCLAASAAKSQDVGIGTFSELVAKTVETQASPTPTPSPEQLFEARAFVAKEAAAPSCTPPFFSNPTAGVEYDYRFIHKKPLHGLELDVHELHSSFAFTMAGTTSLNVDYFHVWTDGENDIGTTLTSEANGVRAILQQPIAQHLIFGLPFIFKEEGSDTGGPAGRQSFTTDSYVLNPLAIFKIQPAIAKAPAKKPLTLYFSPGYRLVALNLHDFEPMGADVDGWNGTFSLLLRADYAVTREITVTGTATWNHLTNFSLSKAAPRPDDNTFALGAQLTYNCHWVLHPPCNETKQEPQIGFKVGYQYDGFNRDSYGHTVTAIGTYRFW